MRTRQRGRRRRSDESVRRPRFSVGGRRRTEDGGRTPQGSAPENWKIVKIVFTALSACRINEGSAPENRNNWKNWFLLCCSSVELSDSDVEHYRDTR